MERQLVWGSKPWIGGMIVALFTSAPAVAASIEPKVVTLDNGLRVVMLEDHSAPVVALQTWVRYGSADEVDAAAGSAHVFEHMLFKGSKRYPNGEIGAVIEGAGGTVNAWTSYDQTVYHTTISSRYWRTGLDVLADAVMNSLFDENELKKELEVVQEEIRRGEDDPDREMWERLAHLAFTQHTYRRPVIGYPQTVSSFTRDTMVAIFDTWYVPNNMTVVAVGDFDADELLEAVRSLYGTRAKAELPKRPRVPEPRQTAPRADAFAYRAELARVAVAFPGVAATDEDVAALDLLAEVLGGGYSSELYKTFKRKENLVQEIVAYNFSPLDPGLFMVSAVLAPERVEFVTRKLLQELARLPHMPLNEELLAAAKARQVAQFVHAQDTYQGIARLVGRFDQTFGDPGYAETFKRQLEAVTVNDLVRVARRIVDLERANVAVMVPEGQAVPAQAEVLAWVDEAKTAATAEVAAPAHVDASAAVTVYELASGAKLVVQVDAKAPLVAVRATIDGGLRAEPKGADGLAELMAAVWDQGTELYSAAEIDRTLDRLGGSLAAHVGRDEVELGGRFLRDHFAAGLELFLDVLLNPTFPAKELEIAREDQLSEIDALKESKFRYLFQAFLAKFYGPDHAYGHLALGRREAVATATRDDLIALHRALLQPERIVFTVVGDIDAATARELFERLLPAKLGTASAPDLTLTPPKTRKRMQQEVLHESGAQTHILWGFPTVAQDHPDRYPLHVLNAVLSGMGGRLFVELRDQKSLAYAVTSFDEYPVGGGFFALYIGCAPDKEAEAIAEFERVLDEVRREGITAEELERAKTYLQGLVDIGLQGVAQRASAYGRSQLRYGTWDHHRQYVAAIAAVSLDDVRRVANTYLRPQASLRMVLRGNAR